MVFVTNVCLMIAGVVPHAGICPSLEDREGEKPSASHELVTILRGLEGEETQTQYFQKLENSYQKTVKVFINKVTIPFNSSSPLFISYDVIVIIIMREFRVNQNYN